MSGRPLTVLLTGTLAVVLLLGAAAAYAVGRAQHPGETGAARADPSARSGSSQPGSRPATGPSSPTAGTEATGPTGDDGPDSGTATDSPESSASSDVADGSRPLTVTLSPSAENSPYAQQVQDLLSRYFTAINNHDYDAWLATVSTSEAKRDRDTWTADYSTTRDVDVNVTDITGGDEPAVRIQFTSHQSVELAPPALPLPCVRWDVTYRIVDEGPGLRVGHSTKDPAMAPCS